MKKIFFISLIGILLLGFSCSKDDDIATEVEIRVRNTSDLDFEGVLVTAEGEIHNYNDIASGEVSDYQTYTAAYRYASISLKADSLNYFLQPIDFVGEVLLEPGKYTYELDLIALENFGGIRLILKEDE